MGRAWYYNMTSLARQRIKKKAWGTTGMRDRRQTALFFACYFAYTATYVARLNLSMASPGLIVSGLMDAARIGLLGSVFSVVYAAGRLVNGWLSDRVSPRLMICSGLVLVSVSNLCIGFFPPFAGIALLWAVNAYAQSMLWSSILRLLSAIYDENTAKKKASYMVTAVATGNILGILINSAVIERAGVAWAFFVPGGITLVMATAVLAAARRTPVAAPEAGKARVGELLRDAEFRAMLIPAVCHGAIKDNISLWMAVYIVERFGIRLGESAYYVLLIPTVGLAARLCCPLCYRLSRNRERPVLVAAFLLCTAAAVLLALEPDSPLAAVLLLSLLYAAASVIDTTIVTVFPIRYAGRGTVASASGIQGFATYLGAAIASAVYGYTIKAVGYGPMFISWIALSLISLLTLAVTGCRAKRKTRS